MQSIFVCFYEFLRSSFFALQNYLIKFLGGFAEEEYNATEFRVWEFQCFSALPSSSPNNCFYAEERFFFVGGRSLLLAFFVCSWIENTTVLAAVYGPKSVTGKKENPEYASLEVIWKPKSGLSGNVLCSYFAFSQMSSLSYLQFFLQLFLRYQDVNLSASDVVWRENNSILAFFSNPCNLTGKFEKEAELIVKRSLESIILAALYPNLGISIILQVAIPLACSISGDDM